MTRSGSEKWPALCRGFGHYIGHRRRVSQFFMLDKLGARQDNGMVVKAVVSCSLWRCCSISCRAWRWPCGHCFQLACKSVDDIVVDIVQWQLAASGILDPALSSCNSLDPAIGCRDISCNIKARADQVLLVSGAHGSNV